MIFNLRVSCSLAAVIATAGLILPVLAFPASIDPTISTGNNTTSLEARNPIDITPVIKTQTVKGYDKGAKSRFECYYDGACKPSPKLHGWAQYLRNRAFDTSIYVLKSDPQVLIDCTDNSELCVWEGDRDASVSYRPQDVQRVIDVIYKNCGGCGLASFGDDPKMGALQMNRPCSCTGDTTESVCSVGNGHKVLKTDC